VLISNVPAMDWQMENQARRFINLVDEFYDRGVKLFYPPRLRRLSCTRARKLKFEFQRTVSRLQEMQSHEYLERPHLP
jgi:cell division protein ZapE